MGTYFPKAGQEVDSVELFGNLLQLRDPDKVSTDALSLLVDELDSSDAGQLDGKVTVGFSEGEVDKAVMKYLCPERQGKWCANTMWDEVHKAKTYLISRVTDHRSLAGEPLTVEQFTKALVAKAGQAGIEMSVEEAGKLAAALVREDGRPDGRIDRRTGNWDCRLAMRRLVQEVLGSLMSPSSYLLMSSKFDSGEIKTLAELATEITEPKRTPAKKDQAGKPHGLREQESKVKEAGMGALLIEIDQALPLIEAYAANPHWVGVKVGPEELQRAREHAQLIARSLRDLRPVLVQLESTNVSVTGKAYKDVSVAMQNAEAQAPAIRNFLRNYLFHIRNGIAHDMGRDFTGIAERCRNLTLVLQTRLGTLFSAAGRTGSGIRNVVTAGRAGGTALGNAARGGGNAVARAWSSAGASGPVQGLVQYAQGNPYKTAFIAAAVVLAIGATAYYFLSDEE